MRLRTSDAGLSLWGAIALLRMTDWPAGPGISLPAARPSRYSGLSCRLQIIGGHHLLVQAVLLLAVQQRKFRASSPAVFSTLAQRLCFIVAKMLAPNATMNNSSTTIELQSRPATTDSQVAILDERNRTAPGEKLPEAESPPADPPAEAEASGQEITGIKLFGILASVTLSAFLMLLDGSIIGVVS